MACKQVRQACKRHLDDLARQKDPEFPYRFNPKIAALHCRFMEQLPHVRGHWARARVGESDRIRFEDGQVFILASIFGWVEKSTGFRRFREADIYVPRKYGKSTMGACIGLDLLCMDGEYGAEIYSGATTERQAMEVFRTAWAMARKTPELEKFFGVKTAVKSLYIEDDGSRFQPVVGDPGDGSSPSCSIIDEYHEHPTSLLLDTMQTGMGAREQPLLLVISTAGSSVEGPCHTRWRELEMILDGRIQNDRRFGIIFTIDKEDDWKSELALQKANPNYGVSISEAFLKDAQRNAIQSSHKQNVFKTKHLNVWVNAAAGWMNMAAWDKCADPSLSIEEFRGQACEEGVDLGAKIDLTSRCKVFKKVIDRRVHYYAFSRHYVPLDRAQDGEHQHYERWVGDGKLVGVPGPEILFEPIQQEIEEEIPLFNRKHIAFDPWSAVQMQQNLGAKLPEGVIVDVPQKVEYLSEPMKEVEAAVLSGRFHHDGDPVLAWAVGCVMVRPDHNDNIFPRKEKNGIAKIDPASALFNAMRFAMVVSAAKPSVYATRGILTV